LAALLPPLRVDLRAELRFVADLRVDFRAGDLRADDFRPDDFRAVDLRAEDFRAEDFRAEDFRAEDFRADDLRAVLRPFFAALFRPPLRPPLRAGALFTRLPRPDPDFLPPPVIALTVAHARDSASSLETPRSL
jgi:hypothetical protein